MRGFSQINTLILGGARSGKSNFAQELALKSGKPVLFVATATASDEELRQRIEEHRKARPADWTTLETTSHLGSLITGNIGKSQTVIIDCITLLVNNILFEHVSDTNGQINARHAEKDVIAELGGLIDCIKLANASFIIVTNEVGLGLVPGDPVSRLYRDLLGKANQMLAQQVDEVYLMTAGIPLRIKPDKNI